MRLSDNRFTSGFGQKARFALLLCIGSVMLTLTSLKADSEFEVSASPFVTEGFAQLEAGHTENALQAFDQALQADGNDLSARLGQAMIYAEQERHQAAFSSYDLIVKRYPQHAFAWNGRGLAAFNLEDFDAALTSFKMATVDQPVNGFFYESLAWTQMCRGEFTDAAESAKKATLMYGRKGESSAYPLLIAYFAYHESGDAQNALRTLQYANKNKPVNQWPAPVIDYLSEKIDESDLISYITNSAEETEAHTYIGLYLRLLGEVDEANQHLQWVSQHGDSQVFEYTLARAINLQTNVASIAH
ncbi:MULTISPECIES: tetratricopeptide repeat protein [unclassified Lentimonas]|uniref:tetratricopeptide repeat protein n=1 Tax=unclassified Lentimonas TaxID=2630993 RepID=UPI00138992B5|nr:MULTISPECIES: tetratricopeptide repeat protein [unclassified Lentimonas]